MALKVLLVNPSIQNRWFEKVGGVFMIHPHPALVQLERFTPKRIGKQEIVVEQWDEDIRGPLDLEALPDASLAAITYLTASTPRAYAIADAFRSKGVPVILGGPHASFLLNEAAAHGSVFIGEAEPLWWEEVLPDSAAGRLKERYTNWTPELRAVPFRDIPHYIEVLGFRVLIVQTGRGCPHSCEFCAVSAFNGRHPRHWPVERILAHVEKFLTPGGFIIFIDDNIVIDPRYAEELFRGLIRLRNQGKRVRWVTQTDIRIMLNDRLRDLAVRSGLIGAFFGIEDPNADILKAEASSWKAGKSDQYEEVFHLCRENFVASLAAMIIGWDADTMDSIQAKIEWSLRMGADVFQWTLLFACVGTPLWRRMKEEGRLLEVSYDRYDGHHAVHSHPTLSVQQREDAVRRAYEITCSPWNTWTRLIRNSFRKPAKGRIWPVRSFPINAGVYVMNRNGRRLWR